jgi:hypothetical protein
MCNKLFQINEVLQLQNLDTLGDEKTRDNLRKNLMYF